MAAKIVKIMKNGKGDAALGEDLTRKVIRDICNVWEFYQQLVRLLFLGDDYQSLICRKLSKCCKKFGDSSQWYGIEIESESDSGTGEDEIRRDGQLKNKNV